MKAKVVKQKKVKLAGEDYFNLLQLDILVSHYLVRVVL